jgi:hypothetical protein
MGVPRISPPRLTAARRRDTMDGMRRTIHPRRALCLALALLGALAAFAADGGDARTAPSVTIASGSLTKIVGERVTLTARARSLPPGASIVILGARPDGTVIFRQACPAGALVCVRRAFTNAPQSVRFHAVVRLRGRTLRLSRALTVTWRRRAPAPLPPPPPPAAALVPTLTTVTPDGPYNSFCGPAPTGGSSGTATYTAPFGTMTGRWSLPTRIVRGAAGSLALTIQPAPDQRLAGGMVVKAPAEFGVSSPAELSGFADVGGSYAQSLALTFTPAREFVAGEKLYIRLENPCGALIYEYVVS